MEVEDNAIHESLDTEYPADGYEAIAEAAPEVAPEPKTFTYKAAGKDVTETEDMVLKRASMGYDYSQKMDNFKSQQEQFDIKQAQLNELQNKWGPIDEYAKNNPEWNDRVQQAWKQEQEQKNPTDILALKGEMQEMKEFFNQQKAWHDDQALGVEIGQLQQKHPGIDFSATDVNGKSLEYKVLEHAKLNGIKQFTTAFRDFYHDQLIAQAREEGKSSLVQTTQQQRREGFIGTTPTPTQGISQAQDLRNKSYDDLAREALAELNG